MSLISKTLKTTLLIILLCLQFSVIKVSAQDAAGNIVNNEMKNEYLKGDKINVTKDVTGDLVAAGDEIVIDGNVIDNAFLAGNIIVINGDVWGDVTVAGGYVIVNGNIFGDIRFAGYKLFSNAEFINGDIVFVGSEFITNSTELKGNVYTDKIRNFDSIPTNIDELKNHKEYTAFVGGTTTPFNSVIAFIFKTLAMIILGYFVLRIFPEFSESTLKTMRKDRVKSIIIGLIALVFSPLVLILLTLTIIGIPLSVFLMLLLLIVVIISNIYASYKIGRSILVRMKYSSIGRIRTLIIGVLIFNILMILIGFIPVFGGVINLVLMAGIVIWTLGAIIINKFSALNLNITISFK